MIVMNDRNPGRLGGSCEKYLYVRCQCGEVLSFSLPLPSLHVCVFHQTPIFNLNKAVLPIIEPSRQNARMPSVFKLATFGGITSVRVFVSSRRTYVNTNTESKAKMTINITIEGQCMEDKASLKGKRWVLNGQHRTNMQGKMKAWYVKSIRICGSSRVMRYETSSKLDC